MEKVEFDTTRKSIPQGDVYLIPIKKIPEGVKNKVVEPENGSYIITHSETGHHHIVKEREDIKMFSGMDIFHDFLRIANEKADLLHLRDTHTHAPQVIEPGCYLIQRQASYNPTGSTWSRAID